MHATNGMIATVTLPTDEQILIERQFNAPRHLVYRAFTEPDLVRRWWHAKRGEVTLVEIDLRVGGSWRYVMVTDSGTEVGFHGEYLEIAPSERLVTTEIFEGLAEGVSEEDAGTVNTATFTELDAGTRLAIRIQAIIASGMEAGLQDALDLLDGVAVELIDAV
jgi:uncharacterized protein YndB with AHSA1/START domain